MNRTARTIHKAFIMLLGFALLAITGTVAAADGRVPLPQLAPAKGTQCVRPTAFMRRNHMKLLLRERHETVHEGIRRKGYNIEDCLACHVSEKDKTSGKPYFCESCHQYAGVRIDCFECHNKYPQSVQPVAATKP